MNLYELHLGEYYYFDKQVVVLVLEEDIIVIGLVIEIMKLVHHQRYRQDTIEYLLIQNKTYLNLQISSNYRMK